jgi:hypothetical protein
MFIHASNLGCSKITVRHQCGDTIISINVSDEHRPYVTCEEVCRDFLAKYGLNIKFSNRGSASGVNVVRRDFTIFRLQRMILQPIPDAYTEMNALEEDDGW